LKIDNKYIFLVLIHVVIGFLIFSFKPLSKVYFNAAMVFFTVYIIIAPKSKKTIAIMSACAYFVGAEVFFRMTKGALAYEGSKYLVIVFVLMGMFFKGIKGQGYPYFLYLILLIPAIFTASLNLRLDANFRTNLAFVLSGPVCLGLASLFFYDRKVKNKEIIEMLNIMSLPIVSMTFYLIFYNPSVKETITTTASNFSTSGGFGPNQVATVLGLGMFAFTVRLLLKSPNLFLLLFNAVFLILMSYRAVITFSRGGVLAAIITILAFVVIVYSRARPHLKNKLMGSSMLFVTSLILTWFISSSMTKGLIDKRYANQDSLGREKADVTTGRVELLMNELEGFIDNPFIGIGASNTKYRRDNGENIVSHNEISRTLSEHGFLGIIVLLILIFKPLAYRGKNKNNMYFYAFLAFWFKTINHSAMRLAGPAFFYALALIKIDYEKRPLYRKRLIK